MISQAAPAEAVALLRDWITSTKASYAEKIVVRL
jgi:hypothetical protein